MAYRSCLFTRSTLLPRRPNPLLGLITHYNDDEDKHKAKLLPQFRPIFNWRAVQSRPFSGYMNRNIWQSNVGSCSGRYMSTTSFGEESDKSEYIIDAATELSDSALEAITSEVPAVSELAAIASANPMIPQGALQYLIDGVHSFTGTNWWASIALTTVLIHGATLPLLITRRKAITKIILSRRRVRARIKEVKALKRMVYVGIMQLLFLIVKAYCDEEDLAEKKLLAFYEEFSIFTILNISAFHGLIFFNFFFAILDMVEKMPALESGGTFWFTDLTTPDSMYILPVMTGLTFWALHESNILSWYTKKRASHTAVLIIALSLSLPKAIFCFWLTSNVFHLAWLYVAEMPDFKKCFGIREVRKAPRPAQRATSERQKKDPVDKGQRQK